MTNKVYILLRIPSNSSALPFAFTSLESAMEFVKENFMQFRVPTSTTINWEKISEEFPIIWRIIFPTKPLATQYNYTFHIYECELRK